MEKKAVSSQLSALDEFLERTHSYAWREMTLNDQMTLREQAATELSDLRARLERAEAVAVAGEALYQACSNLCINDMDKLDKEIMAMHAALKGGQG